MKAITVCQPYAHLISLPGSHPHAKRVENRGRPWSYRGRVAIHAGLSRKYLDHFGDDPVSVETALSELYGISLSDLAFGAVVAVARLSACFGLIGPDGEAGSVRGRVPEAELRARPWLAGHEHVEGPWCLVLEDVTPLVEPVPCKGRLGLWDLDRDACEEAWDQVLDGRRATPR